MNLIFFHSYHLNYPLIYEVPSQFVIRKIIDGEYSKLMGFQRQLFTYIGSNAKYLVLGTRPTITFCSTVSLSV